MKVNEILKELTNIQEEYFSDDYYFSLHYWEAVEKLREKIKKMNDECDSYEEQVMDAIP